MLQCNMKALSLVTELLVDDMDSMLHFYSELLSFNLETAVPEKSPFFVILNNNGVKLMLYAREQFTEEIPHFLSPETGGTFALFLEVENIEELYEKLQKSDSIIQPLHTTNYGTKEFSLSDPSGYVVMLNQHI